jgi:hypothetical protein
MTDPTNTGPTGTPAAGTAGISIASLIVGSFAFLTGLIPVLGFLAAATGLTLTIVAIAKKKRPAWMWIVGGVGSALSLMTQFVLLLAIIIGSASPASNQSEVQPTAPESHAASPSPVESTDPVPTESETPTPTPTPTEATESYDTVSSREYKKIAKDPDLYIGDTILVYGVITQYDSATGSCAFRADTGPKKTKYSFDYSVNSIVSAADSYDCPQLDDVVSDDHVKMWVTLLGAFDYETAIGGTATAVAMQVDRIQVLKHQEY